MKTTKRRKRRQPKILTSRKLSSAAKADLKALRKSISTLKKLGLAFTRIETRKAKKSSHVKKTIAQYNDVLEGRAKVHKIGKKGAKQFKQAAMPSIKVVGERIIVPKEGNTETYVRNGALYRKRLSENGQTIHKTRVLPVSINSVSIEAFIENLRSNPELEAQLKKGNLWAFRYFGNNSYGTFVDLELLANYWERYESVQLALKEATEQQEEYIEALEIFQVPKGTNMNEVGGYTRYKASRSYKRSDYAKSLYQRTKIRNPVKHQRDLVKKRKAAKKRYDERKDDPTFQEARRIAAKKRYDARKPKRKRKTKK